MEQNTRKENRWESIDATGLWRFLFWLCFVLGNMALLLAWGLAHVPRLDYGGAFRPDYLVRLSVAVLMLVCILMARWLWEIRSPFVAPGGSIGTQLVGCAAWIEAALAFIGIVALAKFRWKLISEA